MNKQNAQSTSENANENTGNRAELLDIIGELSTQLGSVERFVSRRFDEISTEINATSQQVDMAEEGIAKRFTEILEVLHAVSYKGDGSTPVNTGVELEAVIEVTEKAANRILDAADRIADRVHDRKGAEGTADDKVFEEISADVQEILLACSFQDLTGQRIRKTLENLKAIEDRLSSTLERLGIKLETTGGSPEDNSVLAASNSQSQDDIDALFEDK